jgi:hypothetical protein
VQGKYKSEIILPVPSRFINMDKGSPRFFSSSPCKKNSSIISSVHFLEASKGFVGLLTSEHLIAILRTSFRSAAYIYIYFLQLIVFDMIRGEDFSFGHFNKNKRTYLGCSYLNPFH